LCKTIYSSLSTGRVTVSILKLGLKLQVEFEVGSIKTSKYLTAKPAKLKGSFSLRVSHKKDSLIAA